MAHKLPVRKVVIPCAGYGTRFLPMTKASPKEMLPIVDKPVIQYIIEEAVASGIEEVVLITGANKRAIEDHFDYNFELEETLKRSNKMDQYREIREISDMAKFVYVRQKEQLGNGHAVLQAKEVIGNEPFVVVWGDEIYHSTPPRIKQLIQAYNEHGGIVLSTFVTDDPVATERYAIATGTPVSRNIMKVSEIKEKPGNTVEAPYHASIGGYIFPPTIFDTLENLPPGKNNEIWLVDAIRELGKTEPVYAYEIENGRYYDCGNKLEYLKANIDFALQRDDIKKDLYHYLSQKLAGHHE